MKPEHKERVDEAIYLYDKQAENIIESQKWAARNLDLNKKNADILKMCEEFALNGFKIHSIRFYPPDWKLWLQTGLKASALLKNYLNYPQQ